MTVKEKIDSIYKSIRKTNFFIIVWSDKENKVLTNSIRFDENDKLIRIDDVYPNNFKFNGKTRMEIAAELEAMLISREVESYETMYEVNN